MLAGYNTNVTYKGNTYHVQTEDNGIKNPVIITFLYSKGAILTSKKTSYANIIEESDYKEKVKRLMKQQHKTMIKELLSGRYTGEEISEEPQEHQEAKPDRKSQISDSLDDILLNYILNKK